MSHPENEEIKKAEEEVNLIYLFVNLLRRRFLYFHFLLKRVENSLFSHSFLNTDNNILGLAVLFLFS